ncbi:hypothetical protein TVAG_242590 [Trichomonas vaginalis G3]|uniref:Protein kinase domain-containing protein n=1 Tax=Trichomonas vaginalis (strain ATCC PRA-98 / G3) TaxID=412133 RepID=A2G3U0_TRIV3|nr:protein serine/threonine kinase protein [Trichomonas vaginalis G3]EAX88175.1 hypothetical protein TVAG_242590 [Trichomonas vaginalis G3]KAI5522690.1 protein serine/threonine kinase protein [Trichomonas vaginalis G3]|eukprot:XP_001301105.1 hypothetical protein [Trichomonas vaginalis G3]
MAPEQFKKMPYSAYQSDIWAFGVTLFMIAFGRLPFIGHTIPEVISSICSGIYTIPMNCPKEIRTLIQHSLELKPEDRWTAKQLLDSLNKSLSCSMLVKRPKISSQKSAPSQLLLQPSFIKPKPKPKLVIPVRPRRNSSHE